MSNFFNGEIIVKIENDKILFRKPTIDYEGKRYKFTKDKNGRFHSAVVCELPEGKFDIDEEDSDEDCVVAMSANYYMYTSPINNYKSNDYTMNIGKCV